MRIAKAPEQPHHGHLVDNCLVLRDLHHHFADSCCVSKASYSHCADDYFAAIFVSRHIVDSYSGVRELGIERANEMLVSFLLGIADLSSLKVLTLERSMLGTVCETHFCSSAVMD